MNIQVTKLKASTLVLTSKSFSPFIKIQKRRESSTKVELETEWLLGSGGGCQIDKRRLTPPLPPPLLPPLPVNNESTR